MRFYIRVYMGRGKGSSITNRNPKKYRAIPSFFAPHLYSTPAIHTYNRRSGRSDLVRFGLGERY